MKYPDEVDLLIQINSSAIYDPEKSSHTSLILHSTFSEPIEKAYAWASKRLLDNFFTDLNLMDRLKSIKHYFFLDLGDFFIHFYDGAEELLEK